MKAGSVDDGRPGATNESRSPQPCSSLYPRLTVFVTPCRTCVPAQISQPIQLDMKSAAWCEGLLREFERRIEGCLQRISNARDRLTSDECISLVEFAAGMADPLGGVSVCPILPVRDGEQAAMPGVTVFNHRTCHDVRWTDLL